MLRKMRALFVLTGVQQVERFDSFEKCASFYRVVMIESCWIQQTDMTELGHKSGEEPDLMHQSQHIAGAPASPQKFHEGPRSFSRQTESGGDDSTPGRLCRMASAQRLLKGTSAACARANASRVASDCWLTVGFSFPVAPRPLSD